ncbi:lysophospholipid acyltransferase family protein [Alphaproteobacteria bacterium KMM 3653]|uniref:Lysophospholipid acyltransferase family protein n=1 Tax=Harenicola maris TaxID=2841044 RepID=A0AAP2G7S6_9RHOB|nr:lysophospholipid acyltransferase family protein [Harenicola maris]
MRDRIDPLVAERAPWLYAPGRITRLMRRFSEWLLNYRETLDIAAQLRGKSAHEVMSFLTHRLARNVEVEGLGNIPREGPVMIVANHPTGIADGIILYHAVRAVRPDIFIFANSDIMRVLPQMDELILPVEWRTEKRSYEKTKQTMRLTSQAMSAGRCGLIFPSGRLAKRRALRLHEREWMQSAAMIARKFDAPVVPVNIQARNSALFYLLDLIHPTLRDITLFRETLNKDKQPFRVKIKTPIPSGQLPLRPAEAIKVLREATLSSRGRRTASVSLVETSPLFAGYS